MMMPSLTSSSSSSSSSATVRVEKATSEFLNGPDWTLNMDICDTINSNQLLAKDVVKAVKKRLQHKNSRVQLLALTLLEAMVKNCGDYVHHQIAERSILQEMNKIVKKKADMQVRDKILTLLDSWQEAFGGPGGKYPQYYWAYDELRRSGIEFPQRSYDTPPIFTPPVTHPTPRQPQPGYGMPSNSSLRLDEAMAAEMENLSLSGINSMGEVANLLADMLQAVNPSDRLAVKDEVIVDLVERCRSNQKKLMQMLATTGDEELLGQGLELNDSLQSLLAKHDAIASGSPLPAPVPHHLIPQSFENHDESPKPDEYRKSIVPSSPEPSAPVHAENRSQVGEDEDEDEEDDFAQLARRHSKARQSTSVGVGGGISPEVSNALVLSDPPAPVRTSKEQDIVEFLSLALSTDTSSPKTPQTPTPPTQNMNHVPVSPTGTGNPYGSQTYLGNQSQVFNSYVAPWAQPQAQAQPQPHPQPQYQFQPQAQHQHQFQPQAQPQHQFQPQAQPQHQFQPQAQPQHQFRPQVQPQHQFHPHAQSEAQPRSQLQSEPQSQTQPQNQQLVPSAVRPQPQQPQQQYLQHTSGSYPPPPWAATPGYYGNMSNSYRPYAHPTPTMSMPTRGSNGAVVNGDAQFTSTSKISSNSGGPKPFIPSYRLFEDLNVLGNADARVKVTSNTSPTLSEARSQNLISERK